MGGTDNFLHSFKKGGDPYPPSIFGKTTIVSLKVFLPIVSQMDIVDTISIPRLN